MIGSLQSALRRDGSSLVRGSRCLSTVPTAFETCVGNTRLVRLKYPSDLTGCDIYGKCEFENPGGSIKDRAALWMIRKAEQDGILKRGEKGIIIEGTAGNTGIGLALAASVFGYRCVICIAETQSEEKKQMLRLAGAHLVEVPAVPYRNPNNYVHVAKRLSAALENDSAVPYRSFYANQWDNLSNRQAHIDSTGPEIYKQLNGKLDAYSCAMGTGGTLSGVGTYLRTVLPDVKIGLTDPAGACIVNYFRSGELKSEGSSISEGIGQGRVTGNLGDFKPDLLEEIPDHEMLPVLYNLQKYDGLALGGSSGINVAGVIRIAKELGPGHTLATVLCDLGNRYTSKLYNTRFLKSKGLPIAPWLEGSDDDFSSIIDDAAAAAKEGGA